MRLTQTEENHIHTHDDGAHGSWEELADATQHHNHTHRNVDEPTEQIVSKNALNLTFRPTITKRPIREQGTYKMFEKSILMGFLNDGFRLVSVDRRAS